MKSKDQFLRAYDAGKEAYKSDAEKRPFWDRWVFSGVLIGSFFGTESWLAHHSTLAMGWRFTAALTVPCLLAVPCSLVLDQLRKFTRS